MNMIFKSQEKMKKYYVNKLAAWLLAVLMLFSALSTGSMTVHAEATTNVAQVGNTSYETLTEAIAGANTAVTSGTTNVVITLLADIALEDGIEIGNKITLDLNGKTLNLNGKTLTISSYLVSNGGNVIDNSTLKTGLLKVDNLKCTFSSNNAQMPVYNGSTGGYVFADIEKQEYRRSEVCPNSFELIFKPYFGDTINSLLTSGSDIAMVDIGIRVEWTDAEGNPQSKDLVYKNEVVQEVYSTSGKAFYITATGVSNFKNLTITPLVKSRLGGNAESCGNKYNNNNNLLVNGSFESEGTGWIAKINDASDKNNSSGAKGTVSFPSDGVDGSRCVLFDITDSGAYMDAVALRQQSKTFGTIEIAKGDTYKLCFDAKVEGTTDEASITFSRIWLRGVVKAGTTLARQLDYCVSGSEWSHYEIELTSDFADTLESLYFQIGGKEAKNVKLYIDNISLVRIEE